MRTPLNGVFGYCSLLEFTDLTAEQRECADAVLASGQNLLDLLDSLIDFSRIEADKVVLCVDQFSPSELLDSVCAILRPRAADKGLSLSCRHVENLPAFVSGDSFRIRQILTNIVGNAIKFTDAGTVTVSSSLARTNHRAAAHLANHLAARAVCFPHQITVDMPRSAANSGNQSVAQSAPPLPDLSGLAADPDAWEFTVSDTGIGLSQDEIARIFEPFTQIETYTKRVHHGSGIGLVICSRLIKLMGGTISVESTPGQGSSFSCSFPLAKKLECMPDNIVSPLPKHFTAQSPVFSGHRYPPKKVLPIAKHLARIDVVKI
jgi:signal transduction histidine kinase